MASNSAHREYRLPYGDGAIHLSAPAAAAWEIDLLESTDTAPLPVLTEDAIRAIITRSLRGSQLPNRSLGRVAVAISDLTRPAAHYHVLPVLFEQFSEFSITYSSVEWYIGTGLHPPVAPADFGKLLPQNLIDSGPVINHNADDDSNLTHLGTTSAGTPVYVNSGYYTADFKIAWGTIERHQFVGISGGAKGAAIGLGGRKTITHNHSMLTHPRAKPQYANDNPVRRDIDEMGEKIGISLYISGYCNPAYQLTHLDLREAEGARPPADPGTAPAPPPRPVLPDWDSAAQRLARLEIHNTKQYDAVIACGGGSPKDCNLYQLQKALANVSAICRDGGVIVLCGRCPEGVGDDAFAEHFASHASVEQVIDNFAKTPFVIGPHKSYLFARSMVNRRVALCSDIDPDIVRALHLTPLGANSAAIIDYITRHTRASRPHTVPKIAIVPHAVVTWISTPAPPAPRPPSRSAD